MQINYSWDKSDLNLVSFIRKHLTETYFPNFHILDMINSGYQEKTFKK